MTYQVANSRSVLGTLLLLMATAVLPALSAAKAQQPTPTQPLPSFHPPALALVQPSNNATIPQDRPIIVFRFAPGDSTDPVDAKSFNISVDSKDRTPLFQVARDMAWGPLMAPDQAPALAVGAHALVARICSIRGACADVSASVAVATGANAAETQPASHVRSLLDLLLTAAKKLLTP